MPTLSLPRAEAVSRHRIPNKALLVEQRPARHDFERSKKDKGVIVRLRQVRDPIDYIEQRDARRVRAYFRITAFARAASRTVSLDTIIYTFSLYSPKTRRLGVFGHRPYRRSPAQERARPLGRLGAVALGRLLGRRESLTQLLEPSPTVKKQ